MNSWKTPGSIAWRWVWAIGYALATFLSFPQPVAGVVLDFGGVLGWCIPVCFLLGLDALSPRQAAKWAFLAGLGAHFVFFHWFYVVTVRYGGAPPIAGALAPLVPAVYIGVFCGIFGAVWRWLALRGAANVFSAALLWVALEHGRSFVLTGFPWALLGYSQHHNPSLLAWAPWVGVLGLSFFVALGGAVLAALVRIGAGRPEEAGSRLSLQVAFAVLVAGLFIGAFGAFLGASSAEAPRVRIGIVQGNIDQGVKWSPEWVERTLRIYEEGTRAAVAQGAEIVLWPETAVPQSLRAGSPVTERVAALARESGVSLVVGAVAIEGSAEDPRYFDSAYWIGPDGQIRGRYDKSHLVPFGEYLPLRSLLGGVITAIARGAAFADVSPGPGPGVLSLAPHSELTAGVPICYELIFPNLVRRFAGRGASVLFALTNDAWYGRTGAPYQFLAITALRSAETGVWTARAANTGVSAFIDARGRVVQKTEIFQGGILVSDVPLRSAALGPTLYARWGDWFPGLCWLLLLGIVVSARCGKRNEESTNE